LLTEQLLRPFCFGVHQGVVPPQQLLIQACCEPGGLASSRCSRGLW
jgi:hypothetical protein